MHKTDDLIKKNHPRKSVDSYSSKPDAWIARLKVPLDECLVASQLLLSRRANGSVSGKELSMWNFVVKSRSSATSMISLINRHGFKVSDCPLTDHPFSGLCNQAESRLKYGLP